MPNFSSGGNFFLDPLFLEGPEGPFWKIREAGGGVSKDGWERPTERHSVLSEGAINWQKIQKGLWASTKMVWGFWTPRGLSEQVGQEDRFKKPQKGGDSNQGATPYSKTPRPLMIWGSVRAFHEPGSRGGAHQDWGEDPEGTLKGPTKKRHQKEGEE